MLWCPLSFSNTVSVCSINSNFTVFGHMGNIVINAAYFMCFFGANNEVPFTKHEDPKWEILD